MKLSVLLILSIISFCYGKEIQLYAGSDKTTGISTISFDSKTGKMGMVQTVSQIASPTFITRTPCGSLWYSTSQKNDPKGKLRIGCISSYKRLSDGTLKLLNQQPIPSKKASYISLDKTSTCLFTVCYSTGQVLSFKLKEDGSISEASSLITLHGKSIHQKRQRAPHPHSIYSSPDNKFVYVADLGTDRVMIYNLDAKTAKLTKHGQTSLPAGSGPRHMAFSPDGTQLYALNELNLTISTFRRDLQSGLLNYKRTTTVVAEDKEGLSCSEIHLSNNGKFVYVAVRDLANKGRDAISVFEVSDDQKLEKVQTVSANVKIPRHFDISPCGNWIAVAGQKSNNIAILQVSPKTGKLSYKGTTVTVKTPMWVGFYEAPENLHQQK